MKKLVFLMFVVIGFTLQAQVAINNDGSLPNDKAVLDLQSSNKGLLIPRIDLDTSSINMSLGASEAGLMVFNINPDYDNGKGFYYWTGSKWLGLTQTTSAIDYDGNTYTSVKIGSRIWMAENLRAEHYADGTSIGNYISYNFDDSLKNIYGYLYSWDAVMYNDTSSNSNPSGVQGVCPGGWHVPSKSEIDEMISMMGGDTIAGGPLKEFGTYHWNSPNKSATNLSHFNAIPAGFFIFANGMVLFENLGKNAFFWTCTDTDSDHAYNITLSYDYEGVWEASNIKSLSLSVRCVKDN